ncbi:MAG: methyl-accepting chemotaxis protein [Verrucomicrobiota bacterium]
MKNWTVQRLVTVGFFVVILLSASICGYSVIRLKGIQVISDDMHENQVPGLYLTGQILQHARQNDEAVLRAIAIEESVIRTRALEMIKESSKENSELIAEREKLVLPGGEAKLFEALKQRRAEYLAVRDEVINLVNQGKNKEALLLYENKDVPAMEEFAKAVEAMEQNDKADAFKSLSDISDAVSTTNTFVMAGSVISVLLCIGVAALVIQMLGAALKNLMLALIQVNGSATEMAATLKEQQASANEVASTSMEIGSTAKEISATTKELGKTMSDVAGVSEQTAEIAAGGQASLSRLESTMGQIMGATASISGKLAILNEKTANINTMVTTINKVADQTNLLSLNAAIEAEKAGEYGQGFAVVATEIRRLADQTAVATYDIEQMVKEMQSAVSAGVMGMDKFAEEVRRGNEEVCGVTAQLVQIIQQVQALSPRFESVNEGMQMQSTAAGQISEALTQLGDTAQQSAQALRQNSDAIEQLMQAAQGLQVAASQLKSKD